MGTGCLSEEVLDKGTIHAPGGMKWDGVGFPHAAQNGMRLFNSGMFHLMLGK